jgi:cell wall-associated NlpC family hydrolase
MLRHRSTRSAHRLLLAGALLAMTLLASCTPGRSAADAASSQVGVPYAVGGTAPSQGFDCSGLTAWAWAQADVTIPRTAAAQYAATTRITRAELRAGDLVFFGFGGKVSHVAMVVGDGRIVQARKVGTRVELQSLDWWASNRIGYGRVEP